MLSKTITIQNKLGLHARAASVFVKATQEFSSSILVKNDVAEANGKSIMNMMLLQANIGSEITLEIDGDDEEQAMHALIELIEQKFGEES